jgi:LysR family glycine cleavage system transcriptional activator
MLNVTSPAELSKHTLIHFQWRHQAEETPVWSRWLTKVGFPQVVNGKKLVFSDETHALQAAIAGQGIALASLALVADELVTGALVCPFGPILQSQGFYLVTLENRAADEKVRAVRDWLVRETASFVDLPLPAPYG